MGLTLAYSVAQNQDVFNVRYQEYENRFDFLQEKIDKLEEQKAERHNKAKEISAFMREIAKRSDPVREFDEFLWLSVIDMATVRNDGVLVFRSETGWRLKANNI